MKKRMKGVVVDFPLVIVPVILVIIGLLCLYSATATGHKSFIETGFGKQIFWFVLGCMVFLIITLLPINIFFRSAYLFYGLSIILLLFVLFRGSMGVHRWIKMGPFQFQPSELAKVATLLALARYFSQRPGSSSNWRDFIESLGLVILPVLLIIKEPDIGTAVVFCALYLVMILWSGIQWRTLAYLGIPVLALLTGFHIFIHLGLIVILFIWLLLQRQKWWVVVIIIAVCFGLGLCAPYLWLRLAPYQQQRLLTYGGIKADPHGAAYQSIQSKIAIGSGGIFGKGFLNGSQTQLRFLPEQHTDFIFSVLGEEFGFIGCGLVLGLFFFFFMRCFHILRRTRNQFASFVGIGCIGILAFQVVINVGMTLGLVPVTGLPLPFLSYGGSALLVTMIFIGFLNSIFCQRFIY